MRSSPRRALPRLLILASMTLAVAACAGTPPTQVILSALDCASLIPAEDQQPVKGAPLPLADATAGDLWVALDGQTVRLDDANASKWRVIQIYAACRAQQDKIRALLAPKKPWWRPF